MARIVVQEFLTLDGVAQGPGGVDEDRDGDFDLGGWQQGYPLGDLIPDWESRTGALLLGRRTYEIWCGAWAVWPEDADGIMGDLTRRYNRVTKYVASRREGLELPWQNSEQVRDVAGQVAALRALELPDDGEVRVWGSTRLVQSLAALDAVDEFRLVTYPIVLGAGKRLFDDGMRASLELVESHPVDSEVVVSVYRPRR